MGYVAAGYAITIVGLAGYAARTIRRARALQRRLPES